MKRVLACLLMLLGEAISGPCSPAVQCNGKMYGVYAGRHDAPVEFSSPWDGAITN